MKDERTKLTDEHFAVFEREVWYWMEYFGLTQWSVEVKWTDSEDILAGCDTNIVNGSAKITLARTWLKETAITLHKLCWCSFHEVCELLLAPIGDYFLATYSMDVYTERAHGIIHALENSVFQTDWDRRHAPQTEQTALGPAIVVDASKVKLSGGKK